MLAELASLCHWHALQARTTFSAGGVECKLNRAALGVNFTCISVAISACGTWGKGQRGSGEAGRWHLAPNYLCSTLSQPSPAWSPARLPFILLPRRTPPRVVSPRLTHSQSCDWCPNPKLISFRASFTLAEMKRCQGLASSAVRSKVSLHAAG